MFRTLALGGGMRKVLFYFVLASLWGCGSDYRDPDADVTILDTIGSGVLYLGEQPKVQPPLGRDTTYHIKVTSTNSGKDLTGPNGTKKVKITYRVPGEKTVIGFCFIPPTGAGRITIKRDPDGKVSIICPDGIQAALHEAAF